MEHTHSLVCVCVYVCVSPPTLTPLGAPVTLAGEGEREDGLIAMGLPACQRTIGPTSRNVDIGSDSAFFLLLFLDFVDGGPFSIVSSHSLSLVR